jgi:hypothetical protein
MFYGSVLHRGNVTIKHSCVLFSTGKQDYIEDTYLPSQGFELGIEFGIELGIRARNRARNSSSDSSKVKLVKKDFYEFFVWR